MKIKLMGGLWLLFVLGLSALGLVGCGKGEVAAQDWCPGGVAEPLTSSLKTHPRATMGFGDHGCGRTRTRLSV